MKMVKQALRTLIGLFGAATAAAGVVYFARLPWLGLPMTQDQVLGAITAYVLIVEVILGGSVALDVFLSSATGREYTAEECLYHAKTAFFMKPVWRVRAYLRD